MPNSTQEAILAELRNVRVQLVELAGIEKSIRNLVHGLYRRNSSPVQPPIPGLVADETPMPPAGEIARTLPRPWSNTVRVYEALWEVFGGNVVTSAALFSARSMEAVNAKVGRQLLPQTVSRMTVEIVQAGAASRLGRGALRLEKPTDELLEKVEEEARKRSARARSAGKEAAHA